GEAFWNNCQNAANAGFHNVESSGAGLRLVDVYSGRSQELKEQLSKLNLNLVGYAQYSPMSDPLARKQLIDLHLTIARVLQPVGTQYITQLVSLPPKEGVSAAQLPASMTADEKKNLLANLNEVGKALRSETPFQIGFHAETAEAAAGLINLIMQGTDPKYFGLIADVGHMTAGGLDALSVCRKYRSRIIAVHLRDWDPNIKYERNGQQITGRFVPLGQGVIDLPKIVGFLRETNFSGFINAEGGGLTPSLSYMVKTLDMRV